MTGAPQSTAERFFGEAATLTGPFGLLGLPVTMLAAEIVTEALRRRLEEVGRHAEARTPAAEDLRLALHAAHAQLTSPAHLEFMVRQWRPVAAALHQIPGASLPLTSPRTATTVSSQLGSPRAAGASGTVSPGQAPPSPVGAPVPDRGSGSASLPLSSGMGTRTMPTGGGAMAGRGGASPLLVRDAIAAVCLSNGWNRDALHRLTRMAAARGVSPEELAASLDALVAAVSDPAFVNEPVSGEAALTTPSGSGTGSTSRAQLSYAQPGLPAAPRHAGSSGRAAFPWVTVGAVAISALLLILSLRLAVSIGAARVPPKPAVGGAAAGADSGGSAVVTPGSPAGDAASAVGPSTSTGAGPLAGAPASSGAADGSSARRTQGLGPSPAATAATPPTRDEFRALVARAGDAATLNTAMAAIAGAWTTLEPAEHQSLLTEVLRAVRGLSGSAASVQSVVDASARRVLPPDSVGASAASLTAHAWSVGFLGRLRGEPSLSRGAVASIDDALARARVPVLSGSADFADGASASLRVVAPLMIGRLERDRGSPASLALWDAWLSAGRASASGGARSALGQELAGLVLATGIDPLVNAAAGRALRGAIGLIDWADDGPARPWLVGLFDDPAGVSVAQLHAITAAVVDALDGAPEASPERVGPDITAQLVLAPTATELERRDTRDLYIARWALRQRRGDSAGVGALSAQFRDRAAARSSTLSRGEALAAAADTAWLATAATALWHSDQTAFADALARRVELIPPSAPSGRPPDEVPAAWVQDFRNARDPALQVSMLDGLVAQRADLSRAVAAELTDHALRPASPLHDRATDALIAHGEEAHVLDAVLNALSRGARPTMAATELIESLTFATLPGPVEPAWELEARRALLGALVDATGEGTMAGSIDRAAAELAAAYIARAAPLLGVAGASGTTGLPARSSPPTTAPPTSPQPLAAPATDALPDTAGLRVALARTLQHWASMSATGRGFGGPRTDEVNARRLARLELARGIPQRVSVDQVALAEAMAAVIARELPDRAADIEAVLVALARQRREADSIAHQMLATEVAIVRLWLIRLRQPDAFVGSRGDPPRTDAPVDRPASPASTADADLATIAADGLEALESLGSAVADLRERLRSLSPEDPVGYLMLGEEVAAQASTPPEYALARRLLVLALHLNQAKSGPASTTASAALALADVLPSDDDRAWLIGYARLVEPALARGSAAGFTSRDVEPPGPAEFEAALTLGRLRAGDGLRARRALREPAVAQALRPHAALLSPGSADRAIDALLDLTNWPDAECRGQRLIQRTDRTGDVRLELCPTCHGDCTPDFPGDLGRGLLLAEAALLGTTQRSWAADLVRGRHGPLRDPDPADIADRFNVPLDRPYFRDGMWTTTP